MCRLNSIDIAGRFSARVYNQKIYSRRKWRFSTSIHENISQTVSNAAMLIAYEPSVESRIWLIYCRGLDLFAIGAFIHALL